MDSMMALLGLGAVLATVGAMAWLIYRGVELYFKARPHLRGHVLAAVLWTLVTLFQTAAILFSGNNNNWVGQTVAVVSGFVMVWSWGQFAERQSGATHRQERRPLLARLFVQSFWGILALWFAAWGAVTIGNEAFDRALAQQNLSAVQRLRSAGFGGMSGGDYERRDGLRTAINTQDADAVRLYLAAGAVPTTYAGEYNERPSLLEAVRLPDVQITEMLWKYGEPHSLSDPLLQEAVRAGQVEQARFLLHHGSDVNEISEQTHFTALKIAKKQGNKAMTALLIGAGATR